MLMAALSDDDGSPRIDVGAPSAQARVADEFGEVLHLSPAQAYAIVKRGVPAGALVPLSAYLGLGIGATAGHLGLSPAMAARRSARGEMLPTHASESLLRLLELDGLAKETFETPTEATGWMRKPHPMLDGETPLACAKFSFGTQRVKDLLVAIKFGGVV